MQRCWQDNPKSRCTFSQITSELGSLSLGNFDDQPALGAAGSVRKTERANRHERPDAEDEGYLVPMQMETAFGADGPYTDNENSATAYGGRPPYYVNRSLCT